MKIDLFRDGGLVGTLNPSACIEASATVGMCYASATIELHREANFLNADYFGFDDPTCQGNYLLFFVERVEIKDTTVIRGQHVYQWDMGRGIPEYTHQGKEHFERYFEQNYRKIGWQPAQEYPKEPYRGYLGIDLPILGFSGLMQYLSDLYRGQLYIRISALTKQRTVSFTQSGYYIANEAGDWYFEDGKKGVRIYRTLEYDAEYSRQIIEGAAANIRRVPYDEYSHPAPKEGDPPVDWAWVGRNRFPEYMRGANLYTVTYPYNLTELLDGKDAAYGPVIDKTGKRRPRFEMFRASEPVDRIKLGDWGWQGYLQDVYLDLKQYVAEHGHPKETFTIEAPVCYGAAPGKAVSIVVKGQSYKHIVKEVTFDLTAPWRQTLVTEQPVEDLFRYRTQDSGVQLSFVGPQETPYLGNIINPEGAEKL